MNYETMTDFEINLEVMKIKLSGQIIKYHDQEVDELIQMLGIDGGKPTVKFTTASGSNQSFDGCNNPADAWPIIVENEISINPCYSLGGSTMNYEPTGKWSAEHFNLESEQITHKNPLRAAMIVFLMMQEGVE